jgi:hypothetical protein
MRLTDALIGTVVIFNHAYIYIYIYMYARASVYTYMHARTRARAHTQSLSLALGKKGFKPIQITSVLSSPCHAPHVSRYVSDEAVTNNNMREV